MKRRNLIVLGLLVAALAVILAAPAPAEQPKQLDKLTIFLPEYQEELLTATVLVAKDKGFFQEAGLDVNLVVVGPAKGHTVNSEVLAQLAAHPDNACAVGTVDAMLLDGVDPSNIKPLFFYLYGSTYDTNLVVSKKSGIKTVADLKGKKVRMGQLAGYIAFENILKEANLTTNDVRIVLPMVPPLVPGELERGTIDATINYLPTMPLILASGHANILKKDVFRNYVMPYIPHSFVGVSPQFASSNPKTVARLEEALLKADAAARKDPTEIIYAMSRHARQLGMPNYSFDKVTVEKSRDLFGSFKLTRLNETLYNDNGTPQTVYNSVEKFQNLLVDHKYISKKVDLSAWKALNTAQVP